MTGRQVKALAIALIVLLAVFFAVNVADRQSRTSAGGLLFPELKARINDVEQVSIAKAGESTTLKREAALWVVAERDGYPADTGKLRKLLLALADASMLEEKTSDPEMYERLGVEDVAEDSNSTEVRITGSGMELSLLIGNLAQTKYRYARVPSERKSWLIDQNPSAPVNAGGWLLPEILDIETTRIQSVTIIHPDGERIHIVKPDKEATNFDVPDLPKGRELRYPGILNGIAGVVAKLNLQDVAKADESSSDDGTVTTEFTTFDALTVAVRSSVRDDNTWIRLSAAQAGDESDEAETLNARFKGWEYQIQSYKGDQLRRRWDDLVKEQEEEE